MATSIFMRSVLHNVVTMKPHYLHTRILLAALNYHTHIYDRGADSPSLFFMPLI